MFKEESAVHRKNNLLLVRKKAFLRFLREQ